MVADASSGMGRVRRQPVRHAAPAVLERLSRGVPPSWRSSCRARAR